MIRPGISPEALQRSLDEARPKVYEARRRVLGHRRYLEAAERAANFLLTTLVRPDGGLLGTYRAGRAHIDAHMEDYAYLCEALIDLSEAGGAAGYLSQAERLAQRLLADFADKEGGGFYSTARDQETLLLRHRCCVKKGVDQARRPPTGMRVFLPRRLGSLLRWRAAGDAHPVPATVLAEPLIQAGGPRLGFARARVIIGDVFVGTVQRR